MRVNVRICVCVFVFRSCYMLGQIQETWSHQSVDNWYKMSARHLSCECKKNRVLWNVSDAPGYVIKIQEE